MSTREIIGEARSDKRSLLTEVEAKELLKKTSIPVIDTRLARSKEEAVSISQEFGFPVALKIASPDIIHKSDSGGVKLNLETAEQVSKAYDEILVSIKQKYPAARTDGVSAQKMAGPGIEVIIGMSKDAQFDPVLMFGLGGILVEMLQDVSFRLVPLERKDAREMLREIKGFALLSGYRGQAPVDVSKLEDLILDVSSFIEQQPEVKELDLNPVIVSVDCVIAVDARMSLEEVSE